MADPPNTTTRPQDHPDELANVHPAHLFQLLFVEPDEQEGKPAHTAVPGELAAQRMRHLMAAQQRARTAVPDKPGEE